MNPPFGSGNGGSFSQSAALAETVARNAKEALTRHRLKRAGDLTARSAALSELGETLGMDNIWVKRPGTGEILAKDFESLLGRKAGRAIAKDAQLRRDWLA